VIESLIIVCRILSWCFRVVYRNWTRIRQFMGTRSEARREALAVMLHEFPISARHASTCIRILACMPNSRRVFRWRLFFPRRPFLPADRQWSLLWSWLAEGRRSLRGSEGHESRGHDKKCSLTCFFFRLIQRTRLILLISSWWSCCGIRSITQLSAGQTLAQMWSRVHRTVSRFASTCVARRSFPASRTLRQLERSCLRLLSRRMVFRSLIDR